MLSAVSGGFAPLQMCPLPRVLAHSEGNFL